MIVPFGLTIMLDRLTLIGLAKLRQMLKIVGVAGRFPSGARRFQQRLCAGLVALRHLLKGK